MGRLPCHYCGEWAGTKDHIVARHWYGRRSRRSPLPQHVAQANKVPACADCNNAKSHWRSDCDCAICELAWLLMAPYILPRKKTDIQVITVQEIITRGRAREDTA